MSRKRPRADSLAIDEIFSRPTRDRARAAMMRVAREHASGPTSFPSSSSDAAAASVTERVCIRGVAQHASPSLREVAQLLGKVGLKASAVSHSTRKDVSFVTVAPSELVSPEARAGDLDACAEELRGLIQRATRILQGSKWKGAVIDAIELCRSEHYSARLKRTWDAEKEAADAAADAAAAADVEKTASGTKCSLRKLPVGEILRLKAPYGQGYVWVSTMAGGGYESETGRPQDEVFASHHTIFHDSDSDADSTDAYYDGEAQGGWERDGQSGYEANTAESSTNASSLADGHDDYLSATSSDEDDDADDLVGEEGDASIKETMENSSSSSSSSSSSGGGGGTTTTTTTNVNHDAPALVPERRMLGGTKGSSAAKLYVEEDWNNSDDDDEGSQDDNVAGEDYFLDAGRGMNLLARLKGGGEKRKSTSSSSNKKKKKSKKKEKKKESSSPSSSSASSSSSSASSSASAISLAYAEESWDNVEDAVLSSVGKKRKRKKKKKESKDKSKDGGDKPDVYDDQKHADVSSSSRPNDLHPMASRDGTNDGTKEVPADTAVASASSTFGPKKSKGADPAKRQNKKRLAALARKQKEQERVKALITASLAAAPKSKKITFSSSDEDEDGGDGEMERSSSKIVMFSSDDEEDDNAAGGAAGDFSNRDVSGKIGAAAAPCPTSDEARFRLKEDYAGAAGKELIKLQRRIGADARFRMDKSFLDSSDDEEDDGGANNDDNKEFEKFGIKEKVIPEITVDQESSSLNNTDLAAEVDGALDALRSVLMAEGGKKAAKDVRDAKPSHSQKGKREKGKEHIVDTWNKVTYDKYDPERAAKEVQSEGKEKKGSDGKHHDNGKDSKGGPGDSSSVGNDSLGDIFGAGNDAGPKSDPSKRFYESKTGFWTTLYHDTKGRTDVVAKKATSSVFRLTDLGLDQEFGLKDLGNSGSALGDETSQSAGLSGIWGGAPKDTGAVAKDAPSAPKPAGIAAVGGFRGFLTRTNQGTFLPFTREGSAEDAHAWWIENRKELTDEFRRKHRDALRGKRNNRR